MNKISTQVGVCLIVLLSSLLSTNSIKAQTVPKLKFSKPYLFYGTAGQINAIYCFPNVTTGVDAYVRIENIVNGARLVNIDDSTLGYYDAWQPIVGGNGLYGSSYIKWDIIFINNAGDNQGEMHKFAELDATAIDIDGDNVRVREFIGVNGQSAFSVPTQIPSLLTISNSADTDNINRSDPSRTNLIALGPVVNRTGIDTLSQDVRLNFTIKKRSEFKMYTGAQVDSNGTTGAIATDRYHCIYFQNITGALSVLPVTFQSFAATLNKNKVDLNWTINGETKNGHIEVERSYDQNNFTTAAIILGSQTSNNNSNLYSFTDDAAEIVNHNIVYYRLKEVDINGSFSYSSIQIVRISNSNVFNQPVIKILPNPYLDKININFLTQDNGKAQISLINTSGSVVKKLEMNIYSGSNNLQIQDLYSQAPGIYILNIVVNGKSIDSQKIIKL